MRIPPQNHILSAISRIGGGHDHDANRLQDPPGNPLGAAVRRSGRCSWRGRRGAGGGGGWGGAVMAGAVRGGGDFRGGVVISVVAGSTGVGRISVGDLAAVDSVEVVCVHPRWAWVERLRWAWVERLRWAW